MVSIGKSNWFHKTGNIKPQQQPLSGVKFGSGSSSGGPTLIDRLDAIDRGQPISTASYPKATGNGGSLLERLDAIGDGELHPKTERKFDILG